jgi:hypothetical protein
MFKQRGDGFGSPQIGRHSTSIGNLAGSLPLHVRAAVVYDLSGPRLV